MPFYLLDDLDLYSVDVDLTGRTGQYVLDVDITGRTSNYSVDVDMTGRTGNYIFDLLMRGQLGPYALGVPMSGLTGLTVPYEVNVVLNGTTQEISVYSYDLSMLGSTAYIPGMDPSTTSTPGAGTPGSPGYGDESLVYYIENQPPSTTIFPWIKFEASYSATDAPNATLTLTGKLTSAPGTFYVSCKATGVGGEVYSATYGPYNNVGVIENSLQDGVWTTKLSLKDTVLDDANNDPVMPELPELVPWEEEKLLPPSRAAALRRFRDEQARAYNKANIKCLELVKALYDNRNMYVDALVEKALSYLPIPYILVSPKPFPGAKIYAEDLITNGGYPDPAGTLIGTSLSTAGKKPLDFMAEVWGRVGFTSKVIRGTVYIGQKDRIDAMEAIADGGAVSIGGLEDSNIMKTYSITYQNPGLTVEDTPQAATGTYALPSKITVKGASYRKWLAPLPDEIYSPTGVEYLSDKDKDAFEEDPNGVLTTQKAIWGYGYDQLTSKSASGGLPLIPEYYPDMIAKETEVTAKANGLLSYQTKSREGYIPYFSYSNSQQLTYWGHQYNERTSYFYGNPDFPTTATRVFTKRSKVDAEGALLFGNIMAVSDISESEEVRKEYHYSGYLHTKITTKVELYKMLSSTDEDIAAYVDGGSPTEAGAALVLYRIPLYRTTTMTETWRAIGGGRWLHETFGQKTRVVIATRDSSDTKFDREERYGNALEDFDDSIYYVKEETDQPPEYAKPIETESKPGGSSEILCVDVPSVIKNGYPYDDQLKIVQYTGGRGDPITIEAPWVTSMIELKAFAKAYVEVNNLVDREKIRATFFVPIFASTLGRNSSMNVSITGSSCDIDVSVG